MKQAYHYPLIMAAGMVLMCPTRMLAEVTHVQTYNELYHAFQNAEVTSIVLDNDITQNVNWPEVDEDHPQQVLKLDNHRSMELNLGGYTITTNNDYFFFVNNGSLFTLRNGTFDFTLGYCIPVWVEGGSSLTMEELTINSNEGMIMIDGSTITINDNFNFTSNCNNGLFVYGNSMSGSGSLYLNGECSFTNTAGYEIHNIFSIYSVYLAAGYKLENKDGNPIDPSLPTWQWLQGEDNCTLRVVADPSQCAKGEHQISLMGAVEPTCTTSGIANKYHCTICNHDYTSNDATYILVDESGLVIPKLGHQYAVNGVCNRCQHIAPSLTEGFHDINISASSRGNDPSHYDLYRFVATQDGTVKIASSNEVVIGIIYDSDFNEIASGDMYYSPLACDVQEGEVCWFGIRSYDGNAVVGCPIIVGENNLGCERLIEQEYDEPYTAPRDGYFACAFHYYREFEGPNWTTWYEPFDLELTDELAEEYLFSRINNVHQYDDNEDGIVDRTVIESFRQKAGTTIKANYPYLVRSLDYEWPMDEWLSCVRLLGAEEVSIDCQSVDYTYTFTGTYTGMGDSGLDSTSPYSLNAAYEDNMWYHFLSLPAHRHYMTITPRNAADPSSAPSRIAVRVVGEEDVNGIVTIYDDLKTTVEAFDLLGRKQNETEGLKIRNGKVTFIK